MEEPELSRPQFPPEMPIFRIAANQSHAAEILSAIAWETARSDDAPIMLTARKFSGFTPTAIGDVPSWDLEPTQSAIEHLGRWAAVLEEEGGHTRLVRQLHGVVEAMRVYLRTTPPPAPTPPSAPTVCLGAGRCFPDKSCAFCQRERASRERAHANAIARRETERQAELAMEEQQRERLAAQRSAHAETRRARIGDQPDVVVTGLDGQPVDVRIAALDPLERDAALASLFSFIESAVMQRHHGDTGARSTWQYEARHALNALRGLGATTRD
jgi:hypothetical protein